MTTPSHGGSQFLSGQVHQRRRTILTAVATAVLAATAAGGCASSPATSVACDSPGVSADEIRIGLVYPDNGSIGTALQAARSGVDARFGLANAAGGINGRKIVYDWKSDDANDEVNDKIVRNLVETDGVFALFEATLNADGGANYLRDHQIPAVGLPIGSVWADPAYPNMFSYPSLVAGGALPDVLGRFVRAQGGSRAVIVQTYSTTDQGFSSPLARSLAAADIPTTTVTYNTTLETPAQFVRGLGETDADVMVLDVGSADTPAIVAAAKAARIHYQTIISISGYSEETIKQYGASVAGLTSFSTLTPFEANIPAQKTYLAATTSYAPELQTPTQDVAYGTYIAADILVQGLQAAGSCPTREAFSDALRALRDYDADGMLAGSVDFTKARQSISCLIFMRVNDAGTAFELVPDERPGVPSQTRWCADNP
ncbi:ABC transporter substrate-binding protein [Frankia sp. CNm7]|uniref:ABC transporter substrate-binding protein n=1 Tax=Frankia nepalensis TaxID=1836974 RepID=A0A937RNZ0_9ACTN|nr:ABC transporter substrate-binding protein [Frankia nepalensis]MBL7498019.1 ABC transporter substrate-binding protein [Frankia nepalensis]MBL7516127.1 ABC transporter substrate-binding protein [Frankia nepalensis]MBL7521968.1 ABC transporter substrate-binding protein [Frankia nepalensis]MBL7629321.1 ABC transporter substrate-binding protein [Frankia nepalensis]